MNDFEVAYWQLRADHEEYVNHYDGPERIMGYLSHDEAQEREESMARHFLTLLRARGMSFAADALVAYLRENTNHMRVPTLWQAFEDAMH